MWREKPFEIIEMFFLQLNVRSSVQSISIMEFVSLTGVEGTGSADNPITASDRVTCLLNIISLNTNNLTYPVGRNWPSSPVTNDLHKSIYRHCCKIVTMNCQSHVVQSMVTYELSIFYQTSPLNSSSLP